MLARALCQEPKLLVLDEPTSFLDIRNKLEFLHLLRMLARGRRIAVIMSLHELDLAQKFSDEIVCIRDGRADRIGSIEKGKRADIVLLNAPDYRFLVYKTGLNLVDKVFCCGNLVYNNL
jgi:iron complex transport system ATP-binding protein